MPIMTAKPTAPTLTETIQVKIQDPQYKSIVVDNYQQPVDSLLTYIDGSSWTVIYFSQVLNSNTDPSPQQIERSAVYQQYKKIENLEIKVLSPLTQSQDSVTNAMTITGSSLTYPHLIPNLGDMFVTDIGNGKQGVFTITKSEKKSYLDQSCYQIDYQLVDYLTDQRLFDLENKTIQVFKFVKDFLIYGQNPQIIESDYDYFQFFNVEYSTILGTYYKDFYSNEMKTFCMPGQDRKIYDHFLVKAFLKFVDVCDHALVKETKQLNVMQNNLFNCDTVWDCFTKLSYSMLPTVQQKMKIVDISNFQNNSLLSGIYFSKFEEVVFPNDDDTNIDSFYNNKNESIDISSDLKDGGRRYKKFSKLIRNKTTSNLSYNPPSELTLPDIDKVTNSDFYIFSPGFYGVQNYYPTSNLEVMLLNVLKQQMFDKAILKRLVENSRYWDNLERYYFIPFILLLIKITVRTN